MEIIYPRDEYHFFKMLDKLVQNLPASEQKNEIIAFIDGYYKTVCERIRSKDIQVSLLAETIKTKEVEDGQLNSGVCC